MKKNNKYLYIGLSLAFALSFGQVARADLLLDGDLIINTSTGIFHNQVEVGYSENSNATLTVNNGAILESGLGGIASPATSTGTVTVTGSGSHWDMRWGSIVVGGYGHGTLNIESGGKVSAPSAVIGYASGSAGVVTVAGTNSSLMTSWGGGDLSYDGLLIGKGGNGKLSIIDGGTVINTASATLGGSGSGSVGTATVSGVGSSWENAGNLTIGFIGAGTLNIENGGKVTNVDGFISDGRSGGAVIVTGSGSRWDNSGQLKVGGGGVFSSSSGNLTINDGGVVSAANGVTLDSFSRISGSGGVIEGNVINNGAVISPGNSNSAGVLTITGDLVSYGILEFKILGNDPGEYDQLIIGGDFTMSTIGGLFTVDFSGFTRPVFDTTFDLIQVGGNVTGRWKQDPFFKCPIPADCLDFYGRGEGEKCTILSSFVQVFYS